MKPPAVQDQGKIIVERDGKGFVMMYPNGDIEAWASKATVVRRAKRYFHIHNDAGTIGIGKIEWRL